MAEPTVRRHADGAADQSIGSLVSLAVSDVSQLVKCEIDLAKLELKRDVKRMGMGGALLGIAAFVGCLLLVLLCFAFAYGLMALGIWGWAAFLIVAGVCAVLALLAVLIGITRFRKLSGLRKTRRTVQDDLTLRKRDDAAPPAVPASSAP
jgi:MFS family permease